jgi:hypothetical protein
MPISDELKDALSTMTPSAFVSRWLLERVPYAFGSDVDTYLAWKHLLADKLAVDPRAISLVGTAAVGTSLNPTKNFKDFDAESDIDVAIVSQYHFNVLWRWLRGLGAAYHGLPARARNAVDQHRMNYVYWGTIATDKLLPHTPLAADWVLALDSMSSVDPTKGREVKARLYADFDSLRAYHAQGVVTIRQRLLGGA